jgi:multiple sugar transport system substrate-binding protein
MRLKGMTWDHPRGYDPLAAAAADWVRLTGVAIEWDRRSLQDFETYPVRELAERYDLIVIDHPHVGQVMADQCLQPFERGQVDAIAAGSLGQSFPSYFWDGHQWALPIDAASQVQAWRPDRLAAPLRRWDEVMALARAGRVACPMLPPHSLMTLFTLCGQLGGELTVEGPALFDIPNGADAYRLLHALVERLDPVCFRQDPIAVFEIMAQPDARVDLSPFIYGYVSYALDGFRSARVAFADLAALGEAGSRGSALGGTGIAVSALGSHIEEASAFARWVAGEAVQKRLYAAAGGQPGHAGAWADAAVNAPVLDFYRATRRTLDEAWVRPRHDGYMAFQQSAADRINDGLKRGEEGERVIADLNRMFEASL